MTQFFNPYAFVPASRRRGDARPPDDGPAEPGGLLRAERWTGRLRLRITAVTPLLVSEQEHTRRGTEQHTQRRTRSIGGQITVPPTTVKGMIRSEFETVTNSRFGVFGDHHQHRLAYRTQIRDSSDLVPVRVTTGKDKSRQVLPLRGVPDHPLKPMAAAWVPRYGRDPVAVPSGIKHRSLVWAWVVLVHRKPANQKEHDIFYWRVVTMADGLGTEPSEPKHIAQPQENTKHRHVLQEQKPKARLIRGWYFCSNRNIGNKHDERIFFAAGLEQRDKSRWPEPLPLDKDVVEGWADLITSYHDAHSREEIHERTHHGRRAAATDYLGHKPGATAWSWHLLPEDDELDELKKLPDRTLGYAEIVQGRVTALYPVALSRKLYQTSPYQLAEAVGTTPATRHDELSPADRVFGWAPPARGQGRPREARALRGRVRVGPVTPDEDAAPEPVERGLAILGQPRPTQDLFYAADDRAGTPLAGNKEGYQPGGGIRGRKVYPHQPGTTWSTDQPQPWLLHGTGLANNTPTVGSQNALLRDWIPSGTAFETDLHVEDLTSAELGALLYVLQGQDADRWQQRFHKLGGGKPLGFGTVTVQVLWNDSDLRPGTAWQSYFALRDAPDAAIPREQAVDTVAEFLRRTATATGERPAYLRAYEHYLNGFPASPKVHYPADPKADNPGEPGSDEKRYEWFVTNRRTDAPLRLGALEHGYGGLRLPLRPGDAGQGRRHGHQGRRR
ncbi:MAG TPA: TIGR03986 family CRISPR-associated RAMP protein [Pseudonocardiaceae bacterium]|nr:TIGR03986 family CRISPR-associated RAMP protein [Pseudonocardiaceae bacterium]